MDKLTSRILSYSQPDRICLQEVSVAFAIQKGIRRVLNQVSLCVSRGDWLSVVGHNGSGKSTLGKVVTGLTGVSQGKLRVMPPCGRPWRTQLVFQNPNAQLIGETIWEDVLFGVEQLELPVEEQQQRAERALHALGLLQMRDSRVVELSFGQRQLLCVASALAVHPDLIVFDEATSMLDESHRVAVLEAATRFREDGGTVIWITHRMDELAHGNRVAVLNQGQLLFDGPSEVFFYGAPAEAGADDSSVHKSSCSPRSMSPCRELGLEPPFTVQVVEHLQNNGMYLEARPLTPTALLQEVFKG